MTSFVERLIKRHKRNPKARKPDSDTLRYPPSGLQCPYCHSDNTIGSAGFYECLDCDKEFNHD